MPPKYSLLDQSLLESLGDDFQEYLDKKNKTTPRDSHIGSFTDAFKAGFANVIGGMADFTDANLGIGRSVGDYANEVAEHNSRRKEYDLPEMIPFVSDFWTHPEGAAYTIGQTVGSSAAMLPVIAGVGYAVPSGAAATTAGLAARALGRAGASSMSRTMAGKTGEMIVRGTAGNIASAVPESMAEGGNVYREMTTGDTPFTDAQGVAAANEVTAKNIPLLMFANAIEAAVIGKALAKPTSLKPGDKLIKRIAKGAAPLAGVNAAQEGLTEFFQETISGEAKGEKRGSLFDPSSWSKEQRMGFGEGLIGGGVLSGTPATVRSAFPVKSSQSTPHERTNDKVNNKKSVLDVPSEKYYNVTDEVSDARLAEATETKLNILSRDFERKFGQKLDATSMKRNGDGSSWHDSGQAVDVVSDILKNDQEARTWLINRASELGLKGLDEYANPSAHATGGHLHFTDNGESLAGHIRTNAENDNINAAPLDNEILQADFATPADFLNYVRDTSQNAELINSAYDALESGSEQKISDVARKLGYKDGSIEKHFPVQEPVNANAASFVDSETLQADFATPADFLNYTRYTSQNVNSINLARDALESGNEQKIAGIAKELGYKEKTAEVKPVSENTLSEINVLEEFIRYVGQEGYDALNKTNKAPKGLTGHTVKVRTDDGTEFAATYKAVPADSLISSHNDDHSINHNYPAELQPRNRERKAMQQQIADIANGLRPADLAESRSINQGAPLVNADNIVENGNGRTLALRRMYKGGHENAPKYKQYLLDNTEKFGLDRAQVEAIPNPVLVRERASDIDVNKIINSTEGGARLAAGEQARVDAGRLQPATLDLFVENDSGDLLTAANRDFTRAALSDIAHKNDINSLLDENGSISQAGIVRIKNALFAKAYGDNNLLAKMSESTDNNIRNITSALLNAAPYVSTTKAKMAEGKLHSYDLTSDVVSAAKKMMALRDEGKPVDLYIKEQSLFARELSDSAKDILQFLDANKQKPKNIANLLKNVSKSVRELGSPDQGRLFDVKLPSLSEIYNEAMGAIINEGQQHIFAADRLQQGESRNDGTVQETTATLERPGARHRSRDGAGSEAGAGKHHEGRSGEVTKLEKALNDTKMLTMAQNALNGHQPSIKALEKVSPEIRNALFDKVRKDNTKKTKSLPEQNPTHPPHSDGRVAGEKLFNREDAEKAFLEAMGKKRQESEKKKVFKIVDDSDAAIAEYAKELRAELNKLSANPMFNPKLMNAAFKIGMAYLQRGANSFADWSKKMISSFGDKIKPFLNSVWDSIHAYPNNVEYNERAITAAFEYVGSFYKDGITNKEEIRKNFVEFAGEEYAGLVDSAYAAVLKYPGFEGGKTNNVVETAVKHFKGDSPRDNQNPMGQDNPGGQPIAGGGQGVSPAAESGVRTRGGERLPGRGADTVGESSNRAVRQEIPGDKASPAGDIEHRRSGADSAARPGQLNDRTGSPAVEGTPNERPDNAAVKENKLSQQADHLAKIRESLPNLMPEQHGDVYFAEKRFSSPDGTGVLFTNGTGTGKTFSGLGIAKRFSLDGKNNILIAIPNDKIISDWIKAAAEKFDLGITQLASTKDNGKSGTVITTYANLGYNNELVKRNWDLIICDESHELMSGEKATPTQALENLRALTFHDRGLYERFKRLHAKEYADLEALDEKRRAAFIDTAGIMPTDIKAAKIKAAKDLDQEYQKEYDALETKRTALVKEWAAIEKHNKPKVTFLSATPFAYVPTVDYAEGYLFEYNKSKDGGGYNVPDGREDFFIKNFGYRMRYNKLTKPDAEVNTSVMEVNFHNMLRKEGALSGRMLSIDKDYDRGFLLINDGIGNKVDEGFDWLFDHNKGEFRELYDFIRDNYKYHEKLYLLEAIKAKHSVDTIKEYLAQGKKIVVFHDYKKGGAQHPFRPRSVPEELREKYDRFVALRPDLINLNLNELKSPINTFKEAFGDSLLLFNGDVPSAIREKNVQLFNNDNSGKNVILVQSDAGQAGISLHDTTGKHPRVLFNLGMPTKPTAAIQIEGRIYRVGQKSNAMFRYLNTGTNMERFAFANKIAERVSTAENLALGDDARNLKESFISAFENTIGTDAWTDYLPGSKNEGTGGRETDRAARERLSDFDRAKAFYYGNMKRNSKTKSAEGIDYYATPEPLGLKMVEWANIKEGDKVMEPSAGHGAIARWFPANTENVFIEPSRELGAMAKMAGDGTLISNTFEDYYIGNKFNAIVMNPPFGTGGKTAMEHVAKAFKHLRDGGRIVALVPEGNSMEKRFNAWYESDEARHAYLAGEISLPTATFERAGTSAKTKILLIDRYMSREGLDNLAPRQVDLGSVKDINELFDRIKDMRMADRHRPGQDMETEADASAGKDADSASGADDVGKNPANDTGLFITGEHIHTKTGVTQYTANVERKLSDTEYRSVAAVAKKHSGAWSRFTRTFLFNEARGRNGFVNEASALLAGEKYSISDTEPPGGRKAEEWTSDIKKAFPTAERIERKGDTFTVNMPNRNVLTVKVGQDIQFTAEDRARAEYALKRPLKPTERPAGTYKHVSNIEGIISLADIADVHTLNHEAYHAVRSLALTLTEQQLLDKYFGRNEEAQADGYAKWLQDREAYKGTVIRRFFQKILDFVNKVKAAFGFENVDNVFRKIAEGEVWNRETLNQNSNGLVNYSLLSDEELAKFLNKKVEIVELVDDRSMPDLQGGAKDLVKYIRDKYQGAQVVNKDTGNVVGFFREGLIASIKNRNPIARRLYAVLPQLIKSAAYYDVESNKKPEQRKHISHYETYYAAAKVDGNVYPVKIVLDIERDNNRIRGYYYHHTKGIEIEVGDVAGNTSHGFLDHTTSPTSSTISISDLMKKSNQTHNQIAEVMQAIGSAGTSLRQVPASFKKITWAAGTRNVDIGGGKYDLGTEYLQEKSVTNLVYDPYNRSTKHNEAVVRSLAKELADTATITNVLNVVAEKEVRSNISRQAAKAIKDTGTAYFQIYEGDRSGNGKISKTKNGTPESWQNNLPTKTYVEEVEKWFGDVKVKGNVIEASNPVKDASASMWEDTDGKVYFQVQDGNLSKNNPDVTDLKYSIRDANNNLIEKLGKFIGEQPAKNVEVKITPNKERLTILESIARSPNAVAANHPVFRMFYKMATKASEVQEKLRDDFGRRLKRINDFVKDAADRGVLQEVLWRSDMEGREYTVQQLKDEGVSENVIHAYVRTRKAIEKAYNLLNDARRQVRTHSQNMNAQEFSELKNNKFAEIIQVVPKENGNVLVTWKSPKTWEKDVIINEQTLELYRQDDAIQILEANQIAKTNALGEPEKQYQVRVRETIPDIHKRGGYLPHFFHNYFIIGDGEVIGSGKTLAEAVKKANKLAEQDPDIKIFIRPKEFKFEGQDVYAAVVGDEEYRRMAEKVAKDSEMTLAEAREYLSDKVKMKPRHRFFGNMLERKGVKGYEQENLNWVLNHYFNSVSRYVALEEFKPQATSLFERYFGRYDKEHTGLAAYAKDYINDINGNPTKLENVLNEALKSSELFRNVLGKYFGDRPALQVASMLTNSMTIAKLGFLNVSSALLNLTQLINAGGILGNPFAIAHGIKRAMNLTATDKKVLLKAGVLNNITFDSSGGYSKLRSLGKIGRGSLWAFKKMDMFARISTVLGAYYQGVNEKGMNSQEAINYAKEVNRDANFDYGVQDAPNIFRRGSVLAQVALQFQKYPIKEFELMWKLYKKGNIRQNAAFWLPYILLAGLFQFPFLELLFDFLKIFDADPKAACKGVVMDWAGKDKDRQAVADWAMYGIFGTTVGIDISQRAGMADIVPTRMPETKTEWLVKGIGGATGSTVYDTIKKWAGEGDLVGGIRTISPALGNYLQVALGETTIKRGRTGTRYDDWDDFLIRFIGFRSVKEAAVSDFGSIVYRGRDETLKREQNAIDAFIDDPSTKNLSRLKELKITPQRVQNERQKKKMDNLERLKDGLGKKELPQYKNILDFAASK